MYVEENSAGACRIDCFGNVRRLRVRRHARHADPVAYGKAGGYARYDDVADQFGQVLKGLGGEKIVYHFVGYLLAEKLLSDHLPDGFFVIARL